MRIFRDVAALPIMIGLVAAAVTGCTAAAATAAPTASHATVPTTTAVSPSAVTSASASASASASMSPPRPSRAPTNPSPTASAPFPGIWDITTWQQYRAAQAAERQGHQPWLLDPESVVQAWAASRWSPAPPVHRITADTFQVTKPGTSVVYTVKGTCPDPTSDAPIWVITKITHT